LLVKLEIFINLPSEVEYNEINHSRKQYQKTTNQLLTSQSSFNLAAPNTSSQLQYGKYAKVSSSTNLKSKEEAVTQSSSSISQAIADCVIKAVYDLNANLIVSFSSTGSTVLKISK
jgi:hypothetical protein